jgi:S4 domain protein YaaA
MEKVFIKTDYITLGQLIKYLSLVGSGGEVKIFLQMNDIYLNGELENRRGRKIYPGDILKIQDTEYIIQSNED